MPVEPRVALVIMAKAPRAGQVKTRLTPTLDHAHAADLYRCFLLDRIEQIATFADVRRAIAYFPPDATDTFAAMAPGYELVAQAGAGLSERMIECFGHFFALGLDGVVLMDSDSPTLPSAFVRDAARVLAAGDSDVVVGPCEDGGYYLIGLRAPHPELFVDMPWSTPVVLEETRKRAVAASLRVTWLPVWFDIDTGADLPRLRATLPRAGGPRHTRRFLTEILPRSSR
ncbi:MAG: TIGR04282 family arsenosugar biosynthesis glycosyltransferase [Candidatus Rokubacteria bacterium]|nr:TIGR04282 family arsenosugar biosynthesis glycosyltransferase [Candidatus Rokubacteria bacterium]